MMKVGTKGRAETVVDSSMSAAAMGSGALDVYATPSMIALMEKAAWSSVQDELEEGCGTVGIRIDVKHKAATPMGMKVWCESELTAIDGRKLTFFLRVFDETGEIGEGTHERFIVENQKFLAKARGKQ